jgi:exopolyphosphatase/guanosine-5'-triphosphate,3'-diphosphate pyrophosphatase
MKKSTADKTLEFVTKTAETYDPDPTHSKQVTSLALALFDQLQTLHGYGQRERQLLDIAGMLHDIGWSQAVSGKHHKFTRDMILEFDIPGLSKDDQFLCALIARYHTKALPDAAKHRKFASLDSAGREIVEWLAGMLRVADGLDCNHNSVVENLTCDIKDRAITVQLHAENGCKKEIERASMKQELLVNKSQRKMSYRC